MIEVISIVEIEDCFDGSFIKEVKFNQAVTNTQTSHN